jgi:2-oxoglutarate ferredoxin oxidoreductase subunit alpha
MLTLLEGSEAIVDSAIAAECRFFSGYPMAPFTELLEYFAKKMPESGGVCINADTEIEAINMAIGAASTGARAATGSTGQGLALMQEAIAEVALNEIPLVVFNMSRNQQDYFQATRGGGWGDYRTITLAPKDVYEAVEHTQMLFHLADRYRVPVILYGDNFLSRTQVGVDVSRLDLGPVADKGWALDGTLGGTGRSRTIWTWAQGKTNNPGPGPQKQWLAVAEKFEEIARTESRFEAVETEDADYVVVAFGVAGKFVEYVVRELRAEGVRVGLFRPVTLWPFPKAALRDATAKVKGTFVFELNAGQMIDDVLLSVDDRSQVKAIGGLSVSESGLALGPLLDAPVVRECIMNAISQGV